MCTDDYSLQAFISQTIATQSFLKQLPINSTKRTDAKQYIKAIVGCNACISIQMAYYDKVKS